jgi:DNA end-binding protein Ku
MRAIWTGNINFSMVSIPAKLYSATNDSKVSLHQYHKGCGGRIKMPKKCAKCEKELEASEIVKGYEISKTKHVILTETDFQHLPLKSLKQIEVVEFVDSTEIDPRIYADSYFLSCEVDGIKAFSLFLQAMESANLIGIAKLTYREREHLSAIRPYDGVMLLHTLHYADELRPHEELKPRQMAMISEKETEMAIALIKAMKGEFELAKYHNDYREALEKLIEAKAAGEPIPTAAAPELAPVEDVAAALWASLKKEGVEIKV